MPITAALVCGIRVQAAVALPQDDAQARQCALRYPDRARLQEHCRALVVVLGATRGFVPCDVAVVTDVVAERGAP